MCSGLLPSSQSTDLPSTEILSHLHDSHAHPTTSTPQQNILDELARVRVGSLCAMSTHEGDQELVKALAEGGHGRVTPCFGHHPWNTHSISLLPEPPSPIDHYSAIFFPSGSTPPQDQLDLLHAIINYLPPPVSLRTLLDTLRSNLISHPRSQLGEVGLDKRARVPFPPSYIDSLPPAERDGHQRLTSWTTPLDHQLAVLNAQVGVLEEVIVESAELAEEASGDGPSRDGKRTGIARRISLHSVGAAGLMIGLLEAWMNDVFGGKRRWRQEVKVCVHACGLSGEAWTQIEKKHPNLYLSASPVVLHESYSSSPTSDLPSLPPLFTVMCSPDRILLESDSPDLRTCEGSMWKVVGALARGRRWKVEDAWPSEEEQAVEGREKGVVEILEDNWVRWMADDP